MTNVDVSAGISDKQVLAQLRQALDLLGGNRAIEAAALLQQVLSSRPSEPDAMQLLGTIRRMQGLDVEAEDLYRRSLAIKPDQPHVHHNLGNLLRASGRIDEAIAEQREAIRLKPNYIEAHLNAGLALADKGNNQEAERCIRRALHIRPDYAFAKQSLGAVLNNAGRPQEAERIMRQALVGERSPRQIAALEHNLGVSASLQNRFEDALKLFDAAQAKVPEMPLVDYNRGNALQHLGTHGKAIEAYRRAVASNPLNAKAHMELNHMLYRMADDENFLRSYDSALARFPEAVGLLLDKANFLFQREDYTAARELFARAESLSADDVMPKDGLGLTLARLGEFEGAIRAHEAAVKLEPANAPAWQNFSETLLRAGDTRGALAAAQESLALAPENQGAIALWATLLRVLGDPRGEELNDFENLIQTFELAPPRGYGDMESFNHDLNEYLDRLHVDKREVITQSLRGGTQTLDNVFGRDHDLIERLRARIDEAVAAYIARMKDDQNHPLLKRRSRTFGYSASWSSRLHDCGYHSSHYHSKGWISSAYYVALPDVVADGSAKEGWIKFGQPPFEAALERPVGREVQPRVGHLVLFPSYMWHGTNPFHAKTARTTIAFDVVPR